MVRGCHELLQQHYVMKFLEINICATGLTTFALHGLIDLVLTCSLSVSGILAH